MIKRFEESTSYTGYEQVIVLRLVLLLAWMACAIFADLKWLNIPGWTGVVMNLIFLPGFILFLVVLCRNNDDVRVLDVINDSALLKSFYCTSFLVFLPAYAIGFFGMLAYVYLLSVRDKRLTDDWRGMRQKLTNLLGAQTEVYSYRRSVVRIALDRENLLRLKSEHVLPEECSEAIDKYLEIDDKRSRLGVKED